MNILSDNLLVLALAMVLGLSPLQSISASVCKCMSSSDSTHHQMDMSNKSMHAGMMHSDNQNDCCEENACEISHCASSVTATIISDTVNEMTYTVSNVVLSPTLSLIQFYPSSLYRPPRI